MLKDNENMPFLDDAPSVPNEPQRFAPEEMVRCEICLRSNPPTRSNCLYCSAALTGGRKIADQRPATLKPLEDSELGYNCILMPTEANSLGTVKLEDAAQAVKLKPSELERIIKSHLALPLARTATRSEAEFLISKLGSLGLNTMIVADADLASSESSVVQIRAADISDEEIKLQRIGGADGIPIPWSQIVLLVSGRLISKRVESAEQKGRRGEKEVIEANEFFADQLVMDLYVSGRSETFRITANNFDYSTLPARGLMVGENFASLLSLIQARSPKAHHDNSFLSLRQILDAIWPSGQRTGSGGLRRQRPGKYSIEAVTESTNANQFTRYSRLRSFLLNLKRGENDS